MNRLKLALGFVTLGILATVVALADKGDAIWIAVEQRIVLDQAGQRSALRKVVSDQFPGFPSGKLSDFACYYSEDSLACAVKKFEQRSAAQRLDDHLAGKFVVGDEVIDQALRNESPDIKALDAFSKAALGVDFDRVHSFDCHRVKGEDPYCNYFEIKHGSPDAWSQALELGQVAKTIGKVE